MLQAIIWVFIVLELCNVVMLYFFPDSLRGNSIAVFKGWEDSKSDEDMHLFIKYLKNWVAGVKLIFIFLLSVIMLTAPPYVQIACLIVLMLSISTFYWGLYPIIKKLDNRGKLAVENYSGSLFYMIAGFLVMMGIGLVSAIV